MRENPLSGLRVQMLRDALEEVEQLSKALHGVISEHDDAHDIRLRARSMIERIGRLSGIAWDAVTPPEPNDVGIEDAEVHLAVYCRPLAKGQQVVTETSP